MLRRDPNAVKKKKGFSLDAKQIRKLLLYGVVALVLYVINAKFFLMAFFIVTTTILKQMRVMFGIDMIMFDTLNFFSVCIVYYWGIKDLFLFLFVAVFMADAVAGKLTSGSFLNYFLFHARPIVASFLLKPIGLGLIWVGVLAQLFYAVTYVPIRIKYMGGAPFDTAAKGVTNILFVYLYCIFFEGLMELLMAPK